MQKHKKMSARILSLALSVAMVTTMLPMTVFAAEGDAPLGASAIGTIQSFGKLGDRFIPSVGKDAPDHVYGLSVALNTPVEDLNLPSELTAMVERTTTVSAPAEDEPVVDSGKPSEPAVDEVIPDEDKVVEDDTVTDDTVSGNQTATPSDTEEVKDKATEIKDGDVPLAPEPEQGEETTVTTTEQETIPVTWNSDKEYNSAENGTFTYTAVLTEDYILADGVNLPQIYVAVGTKQARATSGSEQFNLPLGGTYYFDLSGEAGDIVYDNEKGYVSDKLGVITGFLPDRTFHYVPFTYIGTINAYSLDSTSSGDTTASDNATASDRSLFMTEKNVSVGISWNALNSNQLIFGKTFDSNYKLRSMSIGNRQYSVGAAPTTNEWDSILNKESLSDPIKDWSGRLTWGQDTYAYDASSRSGRGDSSVEYFESADPSLNNVVRAAFRPVLEVLNPSALTADGLKAVELDLNGGKFNNRTSSIQIICAGDSYKAPSDKGLTRPVGNPNTGCSWNTAADGSGTSYAVGASVPSTVSKLYAQWDDYSGTQAAALSSIPFARTDVSITLVAVTVSGETIEYVKSTTSTAPTTGWQDSPVFSGLTADTQYYFFARVKATTTHKAGAASAGTPIKTDITDAEKVANAKIAAVAALGSYTATNATVDGDIMALVNKAITDAGITDVTAAWKTDDGFNKIVATDSATGSVTGTITLKLNSAEDDIAINFTIAQLTAFVITFDANGGSVTPATATTGADGKLATLSTPTRSGSYRFDGWFTAASGGTAVTTSTVFTANNTIYAHWTYTGGGGGGSSSGGGSSTPPTTKPTEPVKGESNTTATVDKNGNATVNVTDKNISDAVQAAKDAASKKGVNAGEVTAVIKVTSPANSNPNTVTVNLPKTVQQQVISNKIGNLAIVIDKPDISIGMNLATITEMNKQANADIALSATRTDATKLSAEAKNAIGNRPAFDLKATYNGGAKSITSFGTGSVSVAIPYTLQAGEIAGGLYAVYIDGNGKANYITGSSYDANTKMLRFATNHFSVYGIGYKAPVGFTDIAGHWAKTDIEFVANRGLMSGTSNTTFAPNGSMTRGMFVTALGRLAGVDVNSYKTGKFTDVKADAYYAPYVNWAASKGITSGTTATTFSPDNTVTRQEMAVFMSNYAKAMGYTVPETRAAVTFADNGSIGSWAAAAVKQMQMAGVLNGKNGNNFDPTGTATRAEVAAVLHRYVELVIDRSTAQGLDTNDSGSAMMYENGKAVKSASRTVNSTTYNFNANGEAALLPVDNKKTGTYTVQKGDSFWLIAKKVGCTMADLEQLNSKSRNDFIYAGQTLKVPQK